MTELSTRPSVTIKVIPILGGILGIVSVFLPWWSAYSNMGLYVNFSLLSLQSYASGITLTPSATLTLQPAMVNSVQMAFVFAILGGILAIGGGVAWSVGAVARVCEAIGGFLIALSVADFLNGLATLANGTWIFGGGFSELGVTVGWGLSYGLFLAGIAAAMILGSSGKRN